LLKNKNLKILLRHGETVEKLMGGEKNAPLKQKILKIRLNL